MYWVLGVLLILEHMRFLLFAILMLYYVLYDILSMMTDCLPLNNHEVTVGSHVDTSGRYQSRGNETIALLHRCCAFYFADKVLLHF